MSECVHYEPPCGCGDARCPECGGLPAPDETFPNIPDSWRVLWCPDCGYAVTFDDATWKSYGAEWHENLMGVATHDH